LLYILRKTESIPRQSEARFLTAAARVCVRVCIKETGVYFQQVFLNFQATSAERRVGAAGSGVCAVAAGAWRARL
jgi:hypothetical protein